MVTAKKEERQSEPAETNVGTGQASASVAQVFLSPELERLNRQHDFPSLVLNTSPKGLKEKLRQRLLKFLFGPYLLREQEFFIQLVRHLNYIQSRLLSAVLRLEDRYTQATEGVRIQLGCELQEAVSGINQELGRLATANTDLVQKVSTLDAVAKGLESIVARVGAGSLKPLSAAGEVPAAEAPADYSYLLLENRFRGSETEISSRLRTYPQLFNASSGPVFEVGAGRGELQELMREAGVSSYAFEQDRAMYEHCQAKGLNVHFGDALKHLAELEEESLGGLIAVQVVEHLPYAVLENFIALAQSRLQKGALLVFETINSDSMLALCSNYFRDPTHAAPLHPDTLSFMLETAGLEVLELRKLSPYPAAACLLEVPQSEIMPPRFRDSIETINQNFKRLNDLIFGFQDYCLIARARK